MKTSVSNMVTGLAALTILLAGAAAGPAFSASKPVRETTTVCSRTKGDKSKLTCKIVPVSELVVLLGLKPKKVDTNGQGCWVQVGMGPHGYVWKSPCPL